MAAIVAETLRRFTPEPGRPVVEIGAGGGQLRGWLPDDMRAGMIHTDPSIGALGTLVASNPGARTLVASALSLPFPDGLCGAVLALCVFDAIPPDQQPFAVREIARILCKGGRFVHFLDMATLLDAPFRKLADSGLIPIPNVFGDPADEEWPLDIVLLARDWLAGLLDFAVRTAHPLATAFGSYFAAFLEPSKRFDVHAATTVFKALASSGEQRRALAAFFGSACQLAFQWGYPAIAPLPFHSGKYLASVLQTAFQESGAFRVELCEIRAEASWQSAAEAEDPRYLSLCLGHQRIMDRLPDRLLSDSARTWLTSAVGSRSGKPGETLVEAGVLAFVAERV